ncbi:MAG: hypothetical protein OEN55_15650 [Alphaproteobacteria bacterium]|nr:hypothetical protein [Alphaproteobacteria bacterium]
MTGALNKALASVIAGLLLLAAGGTFTVATRLASLEAKVDSLTSVIGKIDDRVTYLERERYGSQ